MKRIFLVIFGLFTAICGFSQNNLQPAATVNLVRTEAITVGQLRTEVERMERSAGRTLTQAERLQVLDVMISEKLFIQAAERDRITVTDNEINQQIQQLRNSLAQQLGRQPTDAEYAQAVMNESGLDVTTFREQLRRQMIMQKYLIEKKGTLINSVSEPTEAEVVSEYNLRRNELVRPDTIRFTMILVPFGDNTASRNNARTLANSLLREINNDPAKFDEVVARSVMPNSGYQAGDAGYLPRSAEARNLMGQQFMDVAFALRQGQVSSLIEGLQGFQIIKVTENYAHKNLELNDIVQPGARITVREYIRQFLFSQRQQAMIAQATQEIITELKQGRTFTIMENNIRW